MNKLLLLFFLFILFNIMIMKGHKKKKKKSYKNSPLSKRHYIEWKNGTLKNQARCIDGTPGVMYINKRVSANTKNKWIINL